MYNSAILPKYNKTVKDRAPCNVGRVVHTAPVVRVSPELWDRPDQSDRSIRATYS